MTSPSAERPPLPSLAGDGVALRAHRPEDVPAMIECCRDPEMVQWTTVPEPYEPEDATGWIARAAEQWAGGREAVFVIEANGAYAGGLDLRLDGQGEADVGFGLHPGARGKRVLSRALRLALPWAFEALDLHAVHWRAAVGNWASRRVAWAVGFRFDGTVRDLLPAREGGRRDGWVATLRRGEPLAPPNPWLVPPTIIGPAVVLRPHQETDLAAVIEACQDEATRHWLSDIRLPYGEAEARAHLDELRDGMARGNAAFWAVTDPDEDRMLAEVGVFRLDGGKSIGGEVGYWAHPAARGRGVMTEAVRLACRHAFLPREDGGLGLQRLTLRADVGNAASQRVAGKVGFARSGLDRAAGLLGDGSLNHDVRFDLLAEEFDPGGLR